MSDSIVIVSAARTPIGGLLGDFASLSAHQLGAIAVFASARPSAVVNPDPVSRAAPASSD